MSKNKALEFISAAFPYIAGIFALLLLAKSLGLGWISSEALKRYVFFLPLAAIPAVLLASKEKLGKPDARLKIAIFFICIISISAFRLYPYAGNPIPLGYDGGMYKYITDKYSDALPGVPEESLDEWIKAGNDQGLFIFASQLQAVFGFTIIDLLTYGLVIASLLLGAAVYLSSKEFFGESPALISLLFYSASYTQYAVFELLYAKTLFGLCFFLLALHFLKRDNLTAFTVCFAATGAFHIPEMLVLALASGIHAIQAKDKRIFACMAVAFLVLVPFVLPRISSLSELAQTAVETSSDNFFQGTNEGGGTFFEISQYQFIALAYLPMALIACIIALRERKAELPLAAFVATGAIVAMQLFFFKRYLVLLDILAIVLAGAGMQKMFFDTGNAKAGTAILAMLLAVGLVATAGEATQAKPMLDEQQLAGIEWLEANTPDNAFILATNYDAPWVLGWSKRKVIAPGLFDWNQDNKTAWLNFLETDSLSDAQEFLSKYPKPLYVYKSDNGPNRMTEAKFENSCFERKDSSSRFKIWEYEC